LPLSEIAPAIAFEAENMHGENLEILTSRIVIGKLCAVAAGEQTLKVMDATGRHSEGFDLRAL